MIAVPISGCTAISKAGNMTIRDIITIFQNLLILKLYELIYFANARAVAILANSEG